MDEPLCFVHFINALTCSHEESGGSCSGDAANRNAGRLLPPSQPFSLWEGQRRGQWDRVLGLSGVWSSTVPGLAQFQALGTWEDWGEYLCLGRHHRTGKPLLQVRHTLKWFPKSGSWSYNWKRQVEVPLSPDHLSWGCKWNRDVKLLGLQNGDQSVGLNGIWGSLENWNSEYLMQGFI